MTSITIIYPGEIQKVMKIKTDIWNVMKLQRLKIMFNVTDASKIISQLKNVVLEEVCYNAFRRRTRSRPNNESTVDRRFGHTAESQSSKKRKYYLIPRRSAIAELSRSAFKRTWSIKYVCTNKGISRIRRWEDLTEERLKIRITWHIPTERTYS